MYEMKKILAILPSNKKDYGAEEMLVNSFLSLNSDNVFYFYRDEIYQYNNHAVVSMNTQIIRIVKKFKPDVVFIFKGELLTQSLILYLRKLTKVVYWYPDKLNFPIKNLLYSNIAFVPDYTTVDYLKSFGVNAHWSPFAFDHTMHLPIGPRNEQSIDISFIGDLRYDGVHQGRYNIIKQICETAYKEDWNVKLYGTKGVLEPIVEKYHTNSIVSNKEHTDIVLDSKINLEVGCFNHLEFGTTERIYKVLAVGGFLLADKIYTKWDKYIEIYDEQIISSIKSLLMNKNYRDKKAIEGMRFMHDNNYSYRDLLINMFKKVGVEIARK
jgi:spore maturation protein CgeB